MENEVNALSKQIAEKLDLFYNKGGYCEVFTSDTNIIIKGEAENLSGTYRYRVPGEILLGVDSAKRFLKTLDRVIIINDYLGKGGFSFKVTDGNRLVFEMEEKEIPYWDIDTLYYHLDSKVEKSPLALELNMIKARSLYETLTDLYEQAEKKHAFLESYNELISSLEGKKDAIKFARENSATWLKKRFLLPRRKFDITGDEDIVDTIVNGEVVSFEHGQVPLEKRKKYLTNLENYEHRINNFIERLEIEIKKVESYNEKADGVLISISKCNVFSITNMDDFPEYDCVSTEDILTEEKQRYDDEIKEKKNNLVEEKTLDEKYPWLKDIDQQQRMNLDRKEVIAMMLYKSFMYNLFNNIISYARNNNLEMTELNNDEHVEDLIREEYEKYVQKMEQQKTSVRLFRGNEVATVVDNIFPANYTVDYNRFHQVVLDNVVLLEPALSKVKLNQPLTVYRCVYEPTDSSIYDADLGNALLSTTTSVNSVTDIMIGRESDIKYDSKKVIYKIELPAGSPVITFTDDLFMKYGSPETGFIDGQKEILIDSKNYDFEYVDGDYNKLKDGTYLHSITVKAMPKELEKAKSL